MLQLNLLRPFRDPHRFHAANHRSRRDSSRQQKHTSSSTSWTRCATKSNINHVTLFINPRWTSRIPSQSVASVEFLQCDSAAPGEKVSQDAAMPTPEFHLTSRTERVNDQVGAVGTQSAFTRTLTRFLKDNIIITIAVLDIATAAAPRVLRNGDVACKPEELSRSEVLLPRIGCRSNLSRAHHQVRKSPQSSRQSCCPERREITNGRHGNFYDVFLPRIVTFTTTGGGCPSSLWRPVSSTSFVVKVAHKVLTCDSSSRGSCAVQSRG